MIVVHWLSTLGQMDLFPDMIVGEYIKKCTISPNVPTKDRIHVILEKIVIVFSRKLI